MTRDEPRSWINWSQVTLEAEVTNKGALALYGNLGFIRAKRLHKYYLNGVDAYRLKLLFPRPHDLTNLYTEGDAYGMDSYHTQQHKHQHLDHNHQHCGGHEHKHAGPFLP